MKMTDCYDKELNHYPVDCPIKQALRTIANEPEMFHITKWDVHEEVPDAESGKIFYGKVTLEIDLTSELYFDSNKILGRVKCR